MVATPVVVDSFARTVARGFGSADSGGTYTQTGTKATVSVQSRGVLADIQPGTTIEQTLGAARATNQSATMTFALPVVRASSFGVYQALELRRQSDGTHYNVRVRVLAAGEVLLSVIRVTGPGTYYTVLPAMNVGTVSAGQPITLQGQVTGSSSVSVSARAWIGSAPQPSWTTVVDSDSRAIIGSGSVGSWSYVSAGTAATTVALNALTMDSLSAARPPTTTFAATANKLAVAFDASASTDPDGTFTGYAWDFGDGSTATTATATTSHTYASGGSYTVKLTGTDSFGLSTTYTKTVTVIANRPPSASFTTTTDGHAATFDASGSSDPDGSITSYAWDFGDGSTGNGVSASHAYSSAGTFAVQLTTTDSDGARTTTSHTVLVNLPPVSVMTSSVNKLTVKLDGSASTDSDGTIQRYSWDFGDGTTGTGATATHTYSAPGTYSVKLTTTDDLGAQGTIAASVTTIANQPSVPAFTSTTNKLSTTFDATASSDPDGTITSYSWNFGDGTTGTGVKPTDTYASAGTYTVTLTTVDNDGTSSTLSRTVTAIANSAATPAFSTAMTKLDGSFDASASNDSDGTISSYSWKFGDGTTGTGVKPTHSYASAGTYTVTLTTVDNDGASSSLSHTVTAVANSAPRAAFSSSTTNLVASLDASASTDPDGTITKYAWTFGDGVTGSGVTAAHTYAAAGTYTVGLTVTDNDGATATASNVVTVTAATDVRSNAGSAPVGSTAYAVPSSALYVATTGSDTTGNGTVGYPYATLSKAVSVAASGATIVLRGGTYNQQLNTSKANITIQSYPHEAVYLDGSIPVTGWTQVGTTWVHSGWTTQFDHSASFSAGGNDSRFINSAYPMSTWPDQVIIDGREQQQVASAPTAGQFSVDYAAHTITVGSNPAGHAVRASNLDIAFLLNGANVTVRGIAVQHYATALPQAATIRLCGSGNVLENVVATYNSTQGISLRGLNETARHVTSSYNGMVGIHGNRTDGSVITDSDMEYNNTEHFNASPAAGGIKVTTTNGLTIKNSIVSNTTDAGGIWTDVSVKNFLITGNVVQDNGQNVYSGGAAASGIDNELSQTGIVANNTVSGSARGIYVFDTGSTTYANNQVSDARIAEIMFSQDARSTGTSDGSYGGIAPTADAPWLLRDNRVINNVFGPTPGGGWYQFYVLDKSLHTAASSMNLDVEGNLFSAHTASSDPTVIGWGQADNVTVTKYQSPTQFASAIGKTWANAQAAAGTSLVDMTTQAKQLTIAVPLTTAVATAMAVPTATARVGVI